MNPSFFQPNLSEYYTQLLRMQMQMLQMQQMNSNLSTEYKFPHDLTTAQQNIMSQYMPLPTQPLNNLGGYFPQPDNRSFFNSVRPVISIPPRSYLNIKTEESNRQSPELNQDKTAIVLKRSSFNQSTCVGQSVELSGDNINIEAQLNNVTKGTRVQVIEKILRLIVTYHHQNEPLLEMLVEKVDQDIPELKQLVQELISKFNESKRCREEIVKYLIRKIFKTVHLRIQQKMKKNVSLKKAHQVCVKHFFGNQHKDELLILPFRKNSKLKTMNSHFLETVFESEKFSKEYKNFHNGLNQTLNKDNDSKIRKTAEILASNEKISFNRIRGMPWSQKNLEHALRVSSQLLAQYVDVEAKTNLDNHEPAIKKLVKTTD